MRTRLSIVALALAMAPAPAALAGHERLAGGLTPLYVKECGSCHAPFPPGLMSASDWKRTMARLDRHFGTDASLDPTSAGSIGAWLEHNAGQRAASIQGPEPRITRSAWFTREHDEVPARVWRDLRVKTPANCAACHQGADQGRYGERDLVVPGMARRHGHD
jgi:hypothetical protein